MKESVYSPAQLARNKSNGSSQGLLRTPRKRSHSKEDEVNTEQNSLNMEVYDKVLATKTKSKDKEKTKKRKKKQTNENDSENEGDDLKVKMINSKSDNGSNMDMKDGKKAVVKYQKKHIDPENMTIRQIIEDRSRGGRLSKEEMLRRDQLKKKRLMNKQAKSEKNNNNDETMSIKTESVKLQRLESIGNQSQDSKTNKLQIKRINGKIVMVAPQKQKLEVQEEAAQEDMQNRRKTHVHLRRQSKREPARAWNETDTHKLYDALFIFNQDYDTVHQQVFSKVTSRKKYINPEKDFSERSFRQIKNKCDNDKESKLIAEFLKQKTKKTKIKGEVYNIQDFEEVYKIRIIGKNFDDFDMDDGEASDLEDEPKMSNGVDRKRRNVNNWNEESSALFTKNAFKSEDKEAYIDYSNNVGGLAQSAQNAPQQLSKVNLDEVEDLNNNNASNQSENKNNLAGFDLF